MVVPEPLLYPSMIDLPKGPAVYLIHLVPAIAHARHYVGSTSSLQKRMRCYAAGNADACKLIQAVHRRGGDWLLTAVWSFETIQEALAFEYSFKKSGRGKHTRKAVRHCPLCRGSALALNAERMRRLRARRAGNQELTCRPG